MKLVHFLASILTILSFILTFLIPSSSAIEVVIKYGLAERAIVLAILSLLVIQAFARWAGAIAHQKNPDFAISATLLAIINAYILMKLAHVFVLNYLSGQPLLFAKITVLFLVVSFSSVILSSSLENSESKNIRRYSPRALNLMFNGWILLMSSFIAFS